MYRSVALSRGRDRAQFERRRTGPIGYISAFQTEVKRSMKEWVNGAVAGKKQWSDGLFSLRFEAPVIDFKAGQYTKVALDIDGERVGRPYSLVNAPGEAPLEIYFNEVPEGPLTPRLSDLEPGDPIWVQASAGGIFTLERVQPSRTLWLLATGTALGVYLSILRTSEPWEKFERVILVHGVRNRKELTYATTLSAIAERRTGRFSFLPTLSREQNGSGLTGRITDLLTSGALEERAGAPIDKMSSHVMLCGNAAMIRDVKTRLEARGLTRHRRHAPGHYSTEQYH
jgi:ferredoxin--NADP+ reductase